MYKRLPLVGMWSIAFSCVCVYAADRRSLVVRLDNPRLTLRQTLQRSLRTLECRFRRFDPGPAAHTVTNALAEAHGLAEARDTDIL